MATTLRLWFLTSKGGYAFSCFLAVLLSDRGLGEADTARVFLLVTLMTMLGNGVWAAASDHLRARVPILRLLEMLGLGALLLMLASGGPAVFVAGVVVWAFAHGGKDPVGDAIAVNARDAGATGYGAVRAFGEIGFFAAVLGIGLARGLWPDAPLFVGIGLFAAATAVAFVMPSRSQERVDAAAKLDLLRRPGLLLVLVAAALHGAGLAAQASLFSLRVEKDHLPSWVTGVALALGSLSALGGMLVARRLVERFGAARLFLIAVLSGAPRWLLTGLVAHPAALVAVQLLHATSFALYWVAGVVLVSDLVPPRRVASALGLYTAVTFGVGALLAMGAASLTLPLLGIKGFFCSLALGSVAAGLAVARLALGPRPSPLGSPVPGEL